MTLGISRSHLDKIVLLKRNATPVVAERIYTLCINIYGEEITLKELL